ncbi:MAG: DNA-binding protein [Candidatus Cloacimonadales bacterium]|nr:DNA-binding protein [Candidatus Cloacimonadales bacterium]
MNKNLTDSPLERQNIMNNQYALNEIEKAVGIKGVLFEGSYRFTKKQIADFFEVGVRTIERYLDTYSKEITENGYEVLRANRLQNFRLAVKNIFDTDIDVGVKSRMYGVFDFRSFLNIGMLLTESEIARELRSTILDIVIDTINKKTGGGTKYINQRDSSFVLTYFKNENYRKAFTGALCNYVDMGNFKYPLYTDKIYKTIFREKADEYRKILKLQPKENVRNTLYSEVLLLISSFEFGFSELLKERSTKSSRKLNAWETEKLFSEFAKQSHWHPLIEDVRVKMASRDLGFRDALHLQLKEYLTPISKEDFEKFLGSSSRSVENQLEQFQEVFKRLKERD